MPILVGEYEEGTETGMIKGVNRQMIEVTHTGSPYFERAFLVVRSGSQPPEDNLHRQAERVVQQAQTYAGLRRGRWKRRVQSAVFGALCAGGGALVLWVLERLV